jgi:hypothetical protein
VSRGRRRAAAGRPPTEFTVRHRDSSLNSCNAAKRPELLLTTQELGGFREVESPNGVRFGRGLRRRTPPRGGGTKIDVRRGCADRGILGEPPKSAKSGFSPPAKNPHRVPRRAPGGGRRGSGRGTVPSGLLVRRAGAGRRGKENRKTGKNGVFRRRFEKSCRDTGRNDVRRTRPEATDASARSASIGARRAKSGGRKTEGKSRKFDDSGATFGTVGGPVAVDGERRNSAVGRGDASATRSKNFVPIGRAVRTPGTSARDHPSGEAAKRPIDAGGPSSNASPAGHGRAKLAAARRATRRRNRTKKKSRKSAKAFESYRRFGERQKAGSFEDVRTQVTTATRSGIGPRRSSRQTAAALAQWAERRTMVPEVAGSIPRTDFSFFFLQLRSATKAKSRKRIDNHSQPLPSVHSSTVHETKYAPCGHTRESSIATRGGHCTTTTTTSRKIKPEIASSAV